MAQRWRVTVFVYCTECQLCFTNSSLGDILEEEGPFRRVWQVPRVPSD